MLELPLGTTAFLLAILLAVAALAAYRNGARWSIASLAAWSLVLAFVFALPSVYLSAQGDAAIFI